MVVNYIKSKLIWLVNYIKSKFIWFQNVNESLIYIALILSIINIT